MSCFTRLFRHSQLKRGGEESAQPERPVTSHGNSAASLAGTRHHHPDPTSRTFHLTHSLPGLSFFSARIFHTKHASPIDDLCAAGLTFDCMSLSDSEGSVTDMATATATATAEGPPPKKQKREDKMTCHFCSDAISEIDCVRPCRHCSSAICYDCLEKTFEIALKDHERMPARCCDRVLYPGVAADILPPAELQRYKERYDEYTTPNPFYCPVATCSTFIPPRLQEVVDGKLSCPACATQSCLECRNVASDDHTCERKEEKAILDTYNYKACPKCGTGLMRMYGCAHVRCQCGAHFCWDCERPIQACYRQPCSTSREEGNEADSTESLDEPSDDEAEETSPTGEQATASQTPSPTVPNATIEDDEEPSVDLSASNTSRAEPAFPDPATDDFGIALSPHQPSTANTGTTEPTNIGSTEAAVGHATESTEAASFTEQQIEFVNLDDPEDQDWEGVGVDFGDEPVDENFDIWGCQHHFHELVIDTVPDNWMKDLNKQKDNPIDCMSCWKPIVVLGKPDTIKLDTKKARKLAKRRGRSPAPSITLRRHNASLEEVSRRANVATADDGHGEQQLQHQADGKTATKAGEQLLQKQRKKLLAYDCSDCGVIYCWDCQKQAQKRVYKERHDDN